MLVDLRSKNVTGKQAQALLDNVGITLNKNMIPYDPEKPFIASGVRIGTPCVATRGMAEPEMDLIAGLINDVLTNPEDSAVHGTVKKRVRELCEAFPLV